MKKIFMSILCTCIVGTSFGQQTFATTTEAVAHLNMIFANALVKTPVAKGSAIYQFDYEINEERILIISKGSADSYDNRYAIRYEIIGDGQLIKKDNYFKKVPGLALESTYGESFVVSWNKEIKVNEGKTGYAKMVVFPFVASKAEVGSVYNAINTIAAEKIKKEKAEKEKSEKEKERATASKKLETITKNAVDLNIYGKKLSGYDLFNEDDQKIDLHSYIEGARSFKDKPTLIITWSYKWCNPCLNIINDLDFNDVESVFNIVIVNKDEMTHSKLNSSTQHSYYRPGIISLVDKDMVLAPLDKNGAPMFIWLDKDMKIDGIFVSHAITSAEIIFKLEEIE